MWDFHTIDDSFGSDNLSLGYLLPPRGLHVELYEKSIQVLIIFTIANICALAEIFLAVSLVDYEVGRR